MRDVRAGDLVTGPVDAHLTPEEQHLAEQERLIEELTEQLATKETEFATAGAEFARFRTAYLRRFGPLYSELDRLEAEIARLAASEEGTPAAHAKAQEAATRAAESEDVARIAATSVGEEGKEPPHTVSQDLRDLYRRAAKALHPDMAGTDEERERRTRVMAAINDAYKRGDAEAIQRILDGETARPEAVEGTDVGSRLIRAVRKIAQIRARFTELVQLEEALEADSMWQLFGQCRDAWAAGEDPLAEDEASLRTRIASAHAQLAALVMANANKRRPQQ
jgi:hypothetical protein